MLFNSLEYVLFLPLVVFLYYLTPGKYRWMLLLAASYYFYMCWKVEYIILILASTAIDYYAGIRMSRISRKRKRRPYLILSLVVNLGLLFSFKYFNFFTDSLNLAFEQFNIMAELPELKVMLPVGISFYTFQTLSYTIEVYKGNQQADHHLGYFALYVSYFPQLVAGPIERYDRLAPQLRKTTKLRYKNISRGLRLVLYGLFIKMVIADNLAIYVDQIYATPEKYMSGDLLTGIFFYSFQIYADFHGYSTIAIGTALMMGVNLMNNFKTPYLSANVMEFWKRWHISLSTWFRDYVYIPLGGSRVKTKSRWWFNIMAVFLISGLWHGANWTFVFWGGIFGVVYLIEYLIRKLFRPSEVKKFSAGHLIRILVNFLIVTFAWIFFRSQSIDDAFGMIKRLGGQSPDQAESLDIKLYVWIFLGFFILSDVLLYNKRFDKMLDKYHIIMRWIIYAILIWAVIVYAGIAKNPFIYFQF
ncbi:MAG: MBOAT family O-acyltransferase [Bacteroidales bacterium]